MCAPTPAFAREPVGLRGYEAAPRADYPLWIYMNSSNGLIYCGLGLDSASPSSSAEAGPVNRTGGPGHASKETYVKIAFFILLALLLASPVVADPVDQTRAKLAASGWKSQRKHMLNHRMDKPIGQVASYPGFNVVQLEPEGFIVVPTDDTLPAVIAFSENGRLEPDQGSALWALLTADMNNRLASVRSNQKKFAVFKSAAGNHPPDRLLEQMASRQSRFKELEQRGRARDGRDPKSPRRSLYEDDSGTNGAGNGLFTGTSTNATPVRLTSVAIVDGKVQITHDSDESITLYASFDSGQTWQVLDSGVVWPVWISKQPADELAAFYKAEKDGIYDAMTVDLFRHPPPYQPPISDDMVALNTPPTYQSTSASDIRVSPLIQSRWNQQAALSQHCYDYYTPNNYPCGCVATAMSQLMRYWRWPSAGIGQITKTIYVNGSAQSRTTRGGNGSGGAYDWNNMPLIPNSVPYNLAQWQMIGSLTYDAGVCVFMSYTPTGSGAGLNSASSALVNNFKYSNSRCMWINSGANSTTWDKILRSNLAGGYPVLLGIESTKGGHAVVCDGFGYSGSSLCYHINMGWGSYCDAWYFLPTVDDGYYNFNEVDTFVFNVFPTGTGEIIAGRVVNTAGAPIAGATVTATGSGTYTTSTDSQGYYGVRVAANQTCTISATKSGYNTASVGGIPVGTSVPDYNGNSPNGNYFGADITLSQFSLTAVALTNSVWLRWTAPTNVGMPDNTVYIRWRADRYPATASDGTEVYRGTSQLFAHTNLDGSGTTTNYYAIWGNNGTAYALITGTTQAFACPAPGIFKVFWTNANSIAVWMLNTKASVRSVGYVGGVSAAAGWRFAGRGDIDGDGVADLIWENDALGKVNYWLLDADGSKRFGGTITNLNTSLWTIAGVGDINGDGTADLILNSASLGQVNHWLLNADGSKRSGGIISSLNASLWTIAGVGDINNDRTADLILYSVSLGKVNYWLLNADGSKRSGGTIASAPDGWNIAGVSGR